MYCIVMHCTFVSSTIDSIDVYRPQNRWAFGLCKPTPSITIHHHAHLASTFATCPALPWGTASAVKLRHALVNLLVTVVGSPDNNHLWMLLFEPCSMFNSFSAVDDITVLGLVLVGSTKIAISIQLPEMIQQVSLQFWGWYLHPDLLSKDEFRFGGTVDLVRSSLIDRSAASVSSDYWTGFGQWYAECSTIGRLKPLVASQHKQWHELIMTMMTYDHCGCHFVNSTRCWLIRPCN